MNWYHEQPKANFSKREPQPNKTSSVFLCSEKFRDTVLDYEHW